MAKIEITKMGISVAGEIRGKCLSPAVARHLIEFLKKNDPFAKTIILMRGPGAC